MSTRPGIKPFHVFTDTSMGTSLTSSATIISNLTGVGYELSWTGTPVGSFSVEISNSYSLLPDGSIQNAGLWTAVTLSAVVTAAGTADHAFINLAGLEAYAVRLVYTRSSGSGLLNALVCGKVQ